MSNYLDRINLEGDFDTLISRAAKAFVLGDIASFKIIEVGFEDLNVRLVTSGGEYLVKVFSKGRNDKQVARYVETIKTAIAAGVNHPALHKQGDGGALYIDPESGVSLVVMSFVVGKTFYDMARVPSDDELMAIVQEAVKIHKIDYDPEYVFDSWAIPNMRLMFDKTKDDLSDEGRDLVGKAFACFDAIPFDKLPKCFVHGDIIKTNTIKGDDGKIYIIDFAVANTYPRIQELAVMAANLLFDEKSAQQATLRQRVDKIIDYYEQAGGTLSQFEKDNVFNYALPDAAMEYMGSVSERRAGDESAEILFWEKQGLETLREALGGSA